jgi:hypothetical protein
MLRRCSIKAELRNRIVVSTLQDLMLLRLEGPPMSGLSAIMNPVINHFAAQRNRRADFLTTVTTAIRVVSLSKKRVSMSSETESTDSDFDA